MQAEPEQKPCQNCGRNFPIEKIDLHEAYCCRNIRKCPQCAEMVDINDLEAHHNQKHSKKPCDHCNVEFQPNSLESHQKKCSMKPVVCKYCENTQSLGQIQRHEQMCGARTKPCPICSKLIMLKDFSMHENRCTQRNEQRREQRSEISQDHYMPQRRQQHNRGERQRQNSTNNGRQQSNRSNSIQQKIPRPAKIKPANMIPPETIKPVLDPVPISIRMALRAKDQRIPLKSKN